MIAASSLCGLSSAGLVHLKIPQVWKWTPDCEHVIHTGEKSLSPTDFSATAHACNFSSMCRKVIWGLSEVYSSQTVSNSTLIKLAMYLKWVQSSCIFGLKADIKDTFPFKSTVIFINSDCKILWSWIIQFDLMYSAGHRTSLDEFLFDLAHLVERVIAWNARVIKLWDAERCPVPLINDNLLGSHSGVEAAQRE